MRVLLIFSRRARGSGIELLDDTVDEVRRVEGGVGGLVLKSGREEQADLYVDSSGFRSLLLGETLEERFRSFQSTLYCDSAIVGGWPRRDEVIKPYTTAQSSIPTTTRASHRSGILMR
jgi:tryptophan halogenase